MAAGGLSSRERSLSDHLRSGLQSAWLDSSPGNGTEAGSETWDSFSDRLDRCFQQVSSYVGEHVSDRNWFRHVVTEVLAGSLDLFITPRDEQEELKRLKASADRVLAHLSATPPSVRQPETSHSATR